MLQAALQPSVESKLGPTFHLFEVGEKTAEFELVELRFRANCSGRIAAYNEDRIARDLRPLGFKLVGVTQVINAFWNCKCCS